jgi:hypothetical protein
MAEAAIEAAVEEGLYWSIMADQILEKEKKNAREASGIAAAVTKQTAGKFS